MMRKNLLVPLIVLLAISFVVPAVLVNVGQAQALRYVWVRGVDPYWDGITHKWNFTNAYGRFEVWFKRADGLEFFAGSFLPNGTGFARVSWPRTWELSVPGGDIRIVAKWKTWGGTQMVDGITVGMYNVTHYDTDSTPGNYNLTEFELLHDTAAEAILYRVSIAWVDFHAHSWYTDPGIDKKDNLSYAQVRYYENGTRFAGGQLLGGAVTSGTGDGNTPWQIIPLHHNITWIANTNDWSAWANFTNIAVRVWWESVLVSNITAATANMTIAQPDDISPPYFVNNTVLNMNCSVFYTQFYCWDNNTPRYPLEDARVSMHLLKPGDIGSGYYLTHNYDAGITDSTGLTVKPHAWKGQYSYYWNDFNQAMRFPNGTYRYDPRDARNTAAINDPTKFIEISYLDTLSLADDPKFGGMGIQVRWAGGLANEYGGAPIIVNYTYVPNPYYMAAKAGNWVPAYADLTKFGYRYGYDLPFPGAFFGPTPPDFALHQYQLDCAVFNVSFQVFDNNLNPLRYAEVFLTRLNGPPVEGETDSNGVVWFNQLPGKMPPQVGFPPGFTAVYGVKVYYSGALLYVNASIIVGLNAQMDNVPVVIGVYSFKAHIIDCSDNELRNTAVNYIHPSLGAIQTQTDISGNIDFLATVEGKYNFTSVVWKFVEVKPVSVRYPNGTTVVGGVVWVNAANLKPDPTGPIVVIRFSLADIEITTWDADKESRIPYLNVTLTWVSKANKVNLAEGVWDATGPWPDGLHWQLYDRTNVTYVAGVNATNPSASAPSIKLSDDDPRTPFPYEIVYNAATATTIFKQMPTGTYNITVTVFSLFGNSTPGIVWWNAGRVVYREWNKKFTINCSSVAYDVKTWAFDWSWDTFDGGKHLDNVLVSIENDQIRTMFIANSSKSADRSFTIPNLSTDPLALIWWNGTYSLRIEYHTTFLGVAYDIFEVYNATNTPWMIDDVHTIHMQKNDFKTVIEVPVADVDIKATDKCGNLLYDPVIGNATLYMDIWNTTVATGQHRIKWSQVLNLGKTAAYKWEHVPISAWFNWTWAGPDLLTPDELFYNFEIRVLWWKNSSLVFFNLFNLTKPAGFSGVNTEVYNAKIVLSICRNASRPVKGLNATIFWYNYTSTSQKVYLSNNELWADGFKTYNKIPGPKFWDNNEDSPYDLYAHTGVNHRQPDANYTVHITYDDYMDPDTDELYELVYEEDADLFFEYPFCSFKAGPVALPIKLNATDFEFTALTWRREKEIYQDYPVPNYIVDLTIDNGLTVQSKTFITDATGTILWVSGSDPRTVLWGGSAITHLKIRPPDYILNPGSDFWKNWLKASGVTFMDRTAQWTPTTIPMTGATQERYSTASPGIITVPDNDDFEGNAAEPGVHMPYTERIDYTIVTVRPVDFNGRPLKGAWVQLIELSSGLSAGWSYTNSSAQTNKAGYTIMMNVTTPFYYGEDEMDHYETWWNDYIIRVYWLPETKEGTAVWPHDAVISHPNVYDSWQDEPDTKFISVRHRYGYHADVTTFVYDLSLRFLYGAAEPIAVKVTLEPAYLNIKDVEATGGTLKILDLPRGVYVVKASYGGVAVASKTLDISESNVATVAADITVAVYDLSVTVKNAAGTSLLADAVVDVSGPVSMAGQKAVGGVLPLTKLPTGTYTMKVSWSSPITGNAPVDVGSFTKDISVFKAEPDLLCKVYDIALRVSDTKGRPVSEALITINSATATTDATGTALFTLVPEGSYSLKVEKAGSNLGASPSTIAVSASSVDFAVSVGKIYDLGVRVIGEQGQGLPYSTVYVKDAKGTVSTYTTDANGVATIPGLMEGSYEVTAEYKGFRSESASVSVTAPGVVQEFKLPPYAEVFGVILTYWTFLAIIIGIILLVIVLAVLIHEYVTWRRRRLGIYLPTPPTKK